MEIVRDNYPHSQEDSSSGDTTEEIAQKKSAAGERADEEMCLKEHTVKFQIYEMEHEAGDDTPLPQKDFIFQSDGMEHDFNHNATRCESLIDLFENEDSNGLGALHYALWLLLQYVLCLILKYALWLLL
ncbi:uncharacterized protein LOC143078509 [Mytilus galloprovincialis]|uniref:uncharacterized protein LOC143078509 n=1 Tax=Mytilus galloprovincialis TaxID=29158 RepID=UPI003F7C9BCA